MKETSILLADPQTLLNEQARAKWQETATTAYTAAAAEWDAVVSALHPEESPRPKPPHHTSERKNANARPQRTTPTAS